MNYKNITYINNHKKRLLYKFLKYYYFPDGDTNTNTLLFDKMKVLLKFPEDYVSVIEDFEKIEKSFIEYSGDFIDGAMDFLNIFTNLDVLYQLFQNASSYFGERNTKNINYSFVFFDELIKNFEIGFNYYYKIDKNYKNIEVSTEIMKNYINEILELPKTKEYDKLNRTDVNVVKKQILLNAFVHWFNFYERFREEFKEIEKTLNECGFTCCAEKTKEKKTYTEKEVGDIVFNSIETIFKLHKN